MIKIIRKLPENFVAEDMSFFEPQLQIELPEPACQFFTSPVLILSNGIVLNRFKLQPQSLLYSGRFKEIGGNLYLIKEICKSIIKRRIRRLNNINDHVTVINEWTNNYFHWFTEALPKLMYVITSGKQPSVLLSNRYTSAYQIRSFELMGLSYTTFIGHVIVSRTFLPSRLAPYPAHYNPVLMEALSAKLKNEVRLDLDKGKRIYLSRKNAEKRKILNEEKVIALVKKYNFEICFFEEEILDNQISIMHHAEIFVSIHGAGMTNMIFSKPGTKILELSLQNQTLDKCYYNLACAMNLKYYYQFCLSDCNNANFQTADLIVDLNLLEQNLLKMIED